MATAEQMDALLEGLSADDFDMDFDPNEPEEEEVKEPADIDIEYDDCAPSFVPAVPTPDTTFVGFVTGRNTFIPPPSSEAFAKARKIFDEDPVLAEVASSLNTGEPAYKRARVEETDSSRMPPPRTSGFATGGGRAPPAISSTAQAATATLFAKPDLTSTPRSQTSPTSGFATAAGSAPPPIPPSAQASTAKLFTTPAPVQAGSSSFATARGGAAPPISPAAASASRDLFRSADVPQYSPSGFATASGSAPPPIPKSAATTDLFRGDDGFQDEAPTGTFSLGFQTGAGKIVAPPSSAAQARARSMFDEDALPAAAVPASTPIFHPPQPSNAIASGSGRVPVTKNRIGAIFLDEQLSRPSQNTPNAFTTPRPAQQRQSASGSTFRTPLRTTTNTPTIEPVVLTGSPAPRKFKPIEIGTPLLRRRVGLGMTPGSRFGKKSAGFTTPFKSSQEAVPLPRTSVAAFSVVAAPIIKPVFDVNPPPNRQTYREAYLKPQYTTIPELIEYGIPQEIYQMELRWAKAFRFVNEDGSDLGPAEALAKLKAEGCDYATHAWTLNHWSLIIWKLAGVIQAQHNLYDHLWHWEEVVSQLLYRYEREFGRAERPIVRRIHEHDSSPSLPLVLCVSAIVRPPPEVKEEGDKDTPVASRPFLELTDGWYRITAQVDECLARAIDRGKIKVGRKLAVTGAKLESSGEGIDPLESLDKTLLTIAGNSTSLARWDARLGRQNEPFVAGLSSLSVDGGIISLMDVVIDKLFPLAYTSGERGKGDAPWNEEEELQLQDQWTEKYAAESARLQGEMRKQLEHVEDVVGALCSAAEGVEDQMGDSPDNVDQIFDTLLESQSVNSRLRTMASSTLLHVAAYGRSYFEREAANSLLEVEAELQVLCPVRQVRDFRMARVIDARPGNKVACRTGMLTVWEAKALGEGALVEGRRYMVSKITPGRAGDWRPPVPTPDGIKKEIYLHTRKDTRWQPIE